MGKLNHTAHLSQFPGVAKTNPVNLRPRLATGANLRIIPGLDFTPVLNTQLFRRGTPLPSASVSKIWKNVDIPSTFAWDIVEHIQQRYKVLFNKHINPTVAQQLLSPVENQGLCGSCWAITASSMLSDRVAIYYLSKNVALSTTHLLSCVNKKSDKKAISLGCLGGDPYDAMQFAVKHGVVVSDCSKNSTYNWCSSSKLCQNKCVGDCDVDTLNDLLPTCEFAKGCSKIHVEINSARYIGLNNQSVSSIQREIKRELYFNGPVVASYMVYMDFMIGTWGETNGIYIHGAYNTKDPETGVDASAVKVGGHAICIIGYGHEEGIPDYGRVDYWILRNSWSNKWKDNGYCKVAMTNVKRNINNALSLDRPIDGMGGVLVADVKYSSRTKLKQYLRESLDIATNGSDKPIAAIVTMVVVFLLFIILLVAYIYRTHTK